MSMKIRRIIEDLRDQDIDIKILALTTIPRLSVDSILVREEYLELVGEVEGARQSENADIVFLARKALNVLETLGKEAESARDGESGGAESDAVNGAETDPGDESSPSEPAPAEVEAETESTPSAVEAVMEPTEGDVTPAVAEAGPEDPAPDPLAGLATETDPVAIAKALARLREDGAPEAIDVVLPFLTHEDARVRANAVEVVEAFGDKSHLPQLVPLAKDGDNRVRANAIQALGRFGHPQVRFFLTQMLSADEVSMRESAIFAANALKGKIDVLEFLIRASSDSYEGVRLRSVQSLASYDLPEAVDALQERVSDDADEVREAACAILRDKGVDVQKLLSRDIERNQEADPGVDDVPLDDGGEKDQASELLEAQVADKEDTVFRGLVERISKGLVLQERKAHLSRLLFSVGIEAYEICRTGGSKEKALMVTYYEIVRYQEYLRKLGERLAKAPKDDGNVPVLKAGIEQYHGKLRDGLIKMGKQLADLHGKDRGPVERSPQFDALLQFMGKA